MAEETLADPEIIINGYLSGTLTEEEARIQLVEAGLTDEEADTILTMNPSSDDPDAINIGSVLELMDFLEELAPDIEAGDIEINEEFDLEIVDENGNEATITLLITADNYIPISIITLGLAVAIKASPYIISLIARYAAAGIKFGTVGIVNVAGFGAMLATLSTRLVSASTQLGARFAGTAVGRWLGTWAPKLAKGAGWIVVIDLLIFIITGLFRVADYGTEIDEKPDRQRFISDLIKSSDLLHEHYNNDPNPAETYGLDFPIGVIDILVRPLFYDYIEGLDVSELLAEDMLNSLIQSSLFVMIGTWMGLGIQIIEIAIKVEEADYVFDPSSDLSQFIGDYLQKQEEQLYQTIMKTLIMDPYLLLEIFLGAVALKTLYQVYVPPLVTAFQLENT